MRNMGGGGFEVPLVASLGPRGGGVVWVLTPQPSVEPTANMCFMHSSTYYILN